MSSFSLGVLSRSGEVLLFSGSLNLMARTIDFRNGTHYVWGRIALAEIFFAALVVASLVETIFRGILAIPGALIIYADLDMIQEEHKKMIISATMVGTLISGLNISVALMALFKNLFPAPIQYDEILPCLTTTLARAEPVLRVGVRFINGRASVWDLMQAARS